jgi:hypothetical protein
MQELHNISEGTEEALGFDEGIIMPALKAIQVIHLLGVDPKLVAVAEPCLDVLVINDKT